MKVCVTLEERFLRTPDGAIWSGISGTAGYAFWRRYLEVFDHVTVIARVASTTRTETRWTRADGPGVDFHAVPNYLGPVAYARRFFAIRKAIRRGLGADDALILRVPSPIGSALSNQMPRSRPFGLEVLGDVYEALAPGAIKHPLRPVLRQRLTADLKGQCRRAAAVAYVSQETLQRRYPARPDAFAIGYSDVELSDAAFAGAPRLHEKKRAPFRIVSVGTLEVLYKGFDTLIDAVGLSVKAGSDVHLTIVGDGRCRAHLEERVRLGGLGNRVRFTGRLYGETVVREELDRADLFALASRTEGLPRAMLEAMARALPAIGSEVGALPELLPREALFEPGDSAALARKIGEVAKDPAWLAKMSEANLVRAREYHSHLLRDRRRSFYRYIAEATAQWSLRKESSGIVPSKHYPVSEGKVR